MITLITLVLHARFTVSVPAVTAGAALIRMGIEHQVALTVISGLALAHQNELHQVGEQLPDLGDTEIKKI